MSCLLGMFRCNDCKQLIENPSSNAQRYCDACRKKRKYEANQYYKYINNKEWDYYYYRNKKETPL